MSIRAGFDAEDVPSAAYEDFDVQHVQTEWTANTPPSGVFEFDEPWHISEPLGGLQRDELAELVALEVHVNVLPNAAASDKDAGRILGELSLDGQNHLTAPFNDAVVTNSVGGVTGVNRNVIELESDPDILDFWVIEWEQETDETNGVANHHAGRYDMFHDFRGVYGQGPVVDRHTDLFWHLAQDLITNDSQAFLNWYVKMVWDVFDSPR